MSRTHYSYSLYAERTTAESFDRARFGGPIGRLLADTQARVLETFLPEVNQRAVLDVGTGTGRAALLLARRGARVTGLDASAEMLRIAGQRAAGESVTVTFVVGDAHALACGDRAFDAVVSLRVLMHTPDWRRSLAELCRVARGRVVVDYPALASVAALQAVARWLLSRAGRRVEAYRVFTRRSIARELARHGFRIAGVHRQFVLPIALHKAIGRPSATVAVERGLAAVGMLRLFGSPVTIVAERCNHG